MKCVVCTTGEMSEAKVSTCLHRGSRVALFSSVPAFRCDQCGALEFTDEVTQRLTALLEDDVRPTSYITARHYDLDRLASQPREETTSTAIGTFTRIVKRVQAEPALPLAGSQPLVPTGT